MTRTLGWSGALLALVAMAGCNSGKPAGGERHLTLAITSRFEANFNPYRDQIMTFQPLHSLMFDCLFKMDSAMQPRPWLVERTERDGKAVLFTLKPNLRFSDGRPLTASDVAASITGSLRESPTPNPIYRDIAGGEEFMAGRADTVAGLQVLSPVSFRIEFRSENNEYPYYLASLNFAIRPADWSVKNPVGSGAFRVDSLRYDGTKALIHLRRNPHYHSAGDPGIDELVFEYFTRDTDFVSAVRGEKVDAYFNFLSLALTEVPVSYRPHRMPILGGFYIGLNPGAAETADPGFRRWLASRFDFDGLLSRKKWDIVSPSHRVLPYGMAEYFLFRPIVRQPEERRYFPQLKRLRAVNMQSSIRPELLAFMREELARNNVQLDLEWGSYQEVEARKGRGDYNLTSFFYLTDVPLAIHFYELLFTPGLELNPGYTVPEALRLLADYREERDGRRRLEILLRLEEIARAECFQIPVCNPVTTLGFRRPIGRLRLNYLLQFDLSPDQP